VTSEVACPDGWAGRMLPSPLLHCGTGKLHCETTPVALEATPTVWLCQGILVLVRRVCAELSLGRCETVVLQLFYQALQ
jgi:hypothetical protein